MSLDLIIYEYQIKSTSMDNLIHHIHWTPASLSPEPIRFHKVIFLDSDRDHQPSVAAFSHQLNSEGLETVTVYDVDQLEPLLSPGAIVVHIPQAASDKKRVYEAVTTSCISLIAATQLLCSWRRRQGWSNRDKTQDTPVLFCLVTKDFGIGDLAHSPLHGLARVLATEAGGAFGGLFEEDQGRFPLSAIRHAQGFDVVRVCDGVAQTAALRPLLQEGLNSKRAGVRLSAQSTYLITGGTRGMGLEIATWMVQRGARNILLVSRHGRQTAPQGDSNPQNNDINTLVSRIAELESVGAKVNVLAVDMSKPDAHSTLQQAIQALSIPPIKGVVHAAGVGGYHTLERCVPTGGTDVLAPKIVGALCLDALFPPGTLDFFVMTSSVGQLVGFPGQLFYAPANSFLDGLAAYRRRQGDNTTSIQWTCWRGVGLMVQNKSATRMIESGMRERGIQDVQKEEAFAAWDCIAGLDVDQAAVVRTSMINADEPPRHPMLRDITLRKTPENTEGPGPIKNLKDYPKDAIAVVGMACRTAAGNTLNDLWQVIQNGQTMEREIDVQRFPDKANIKGKRWGNFLPDAQSFDHQFFKKSKREAAALDPHQRVLLETTYQAIEAAGWLGVDGHRDAETHDQSKEKSHITGCFIGMNAPDYPINLACHPASPYTGFGMLRSFVAGRLSHHFGWTGPSQTVDTACSSAMVAVHQACRAIQAGECTQAIAGGVNLITNTALFEALHVGGFLNPSGPCYTFDERAAGYCRGEAAGVVVLKPIHSAVQDGDDIQGVLLATGNNQNINSTSITNPVLESQVALYTQVLARAGVSPKDVSYVEAHGTGTRAGDPVEVEGIRKVLGGPERRSTLHVGAVKPNIGHSEGASGIVSLIKVLLMLRHGKITPQANFQQLNPSIRALEPDCMAISRSLKEWDSVLRLALVNSYGASGNNAAAVVAPPPPRSASVSVSSSPPPMVPVKLPSTWPIIVTAASKSSLAKHCHQLSNQLSSSPATPPIDLASALSLKQNRQLEHMFCTTASSCTYCDPSLTLHKIVFFRYTASNPYVAGDLQGQLSDTDKHTMILQKSKPVVLLLSGQNGNTVLSSRPLYEVSVLFRRHLHRCDDVLRSLGLPGVFPGALDGVQGDSDICLRHAVMFSIQYSCGMSWIDAGVKPEAVCGHSFGEWAALTVAGALTLEAGMRLVTGYAQNLLLTKPT